MFPTHSMRSPTRRLLVFLFPRITSLELSLIQSPKFDCSRMNYPLLRMYYPFANKHVTELEHIYKLEELKWRQRSILVMIGLTLLTIWKWTIEYILHVTFEIIVVSNSLSLSGHHDNVPLHNIMQYLVSLVSKSHLKTCDNPNRIPQNP